MTEHDPMLTDRLELRRWRRSDFPDYLRLDADPSVMRFVGGPVNPWTRPLWLERRMAEGWPAQGGMWTVRRRADGRFLGWCGLFPIPLQSSRYGPQHHEIGYRYMSHAWGHGYATEAARKVLDHGFRFLGLDPIVGVTDPDNYASQHVLQKIGLRREGQRVAYDLSLAFFSLKRQTYLQQAAGSS